MVKSAYRGAAFPIDDPGRLFELVARHAHDVLLVTEAAPVVAPGPRIVYVNEAFTQMTGYSREEAIGQNPRFLQGPNTDPATRARIHAALVAWQPVMAELVNYRKDGTPFWVEMSIVPVPDGTGDYRHWLAIQRDVTTRKEADIAARAADLVQAEVAALKKADALKTAFMRIVAHELRTPLTGILGFAELLQMRDVPPALAQEYIAKIVVSSKRMQTLLDDYLNLQRLEAGADVLRLTPTDIGAIIGAAGAVVDPQRHPLTIVQPAALPEITADAAKIRRVIENVLTNAAKYSADGAAITISATADATAIVVAVADAGMGIPLDAQPYIFDAFYRGRADAFGMTPPGSGLGLAISREIVERHGGSITFASSPAGTTFYVRLPIDGPPPCYPA